jgi:hypothetical protein
MLSTIQVLSVQKIRKEQKEKEVKNMGTKNRDKADDVVVNRKDMKGDTFEGTIDNVSVITREIEVEDKKTGEKRKEDRDYIHIELEVPFMQDKLYSIDLPPSEKEESAWGYWLKALNEDAGIEIEKLKDLEGLHLEFERRPIVLTSGFVAKKECPMPIADLSAQKK